MIPQLPALVDQLGFGISLLPLAFAVLVTGMVLVARSLAQWFNDRKP